jgi:hypothetical protein
MVGERKRETRKREENAHMRPINRQWRVELRGSVVAEGGRRRAKLKK